MSVSGRTSVRKDSKDKVHPGHEASKGKLKEGEITVTIYN